MIILLDNGQNELKRVIVTGYGFLVVVSTLVGFLIPHPHGKSLEQPHASVIEGRGGKLLVMNEYEEFITYSVLFSPFLRLRTG